MSLLLGASGCGGNRPPVDPPLPKLSDLATSSSHEPGESPFNRGVVAVVAVRRIWLPANESMETLWRDIAIHSLSDAEVDQWRANGLSAAVVNRVDVPAFFQKLSAEYGVRQQLFTLSSELAPLEPANGRVARRPTHVQTPGGSEIATGGRLRFLMSADPQSGDWVKLTIIPQLHQPQVELLPRLPSESALDGRIYTGLMLRALLAPGKVLLVAPRLPVEAFDDTPPAATQPAEEPATQPAASQPVEQVLELPPLSVDPPPPGLGQSLLTGHLGRALMQQLLLIEVEKAPTSPAAPSRAAGQP